MKICACVAEYNPFHLGHVRHIRYMKEDLGFDRVIAVMSGNFTQRGEPAAADKFTRAKWAVLAGADLVIELPTVFASANAELFASGAVTLIDALHTAQGLCFGAESGSAEEFLTAARALMTESKDFQKAIRRQLDTGVSHAAARLAAVRELGIEGVDPALTETPNNILGLEYCKRLVRLKSELAVYPLLRENTHNDGQLKRGVTSATSIRGALARGEKRKLKRCVPPYVYRDLPKFLPDFDKMILSRLFSSPAEEMRGILDCTEGLENRIKALIKDNLVYSAALDKIATKRYTYARIRRICIANLLGIQESLVREALESRLYANVLAVRADATDLLALVRRNASVPVLTRKSDFSVLEKTAQRAMEKDILANDLYNLASGRRTNEYQMLTV